MQGKIFQEETGSFEGRGCRFAQAFDLTGCRSKTIIQDALIIVLLVAVGLVFRLYGAVWDMIIYPDSTQYLSLANDILRGAIFAANFHLHEGFLGARELPPLYSSLIALSTLVGFKPEHGGVFISLLMSLLTIVPLYVAARVLYSRWVAIFTVAVFAFHPIVLKFSTAILTESAFCAGYVTLLALFVYTLKRPGTLVFGLMGLAGALVYLTREPGLIAFPTVLLITVVSLGVIEKKRWPQLGKWILCYSAVFLVAASPLLIHVRVRTGKWGLTARGIPGGIESYLLKSFSSGSNPSGGEYSPTLQGAERRMEKKTPESKWKALAGKLLVNAPAYGGALVVFLGPCLSAMLILWLAGMAASILGGGSRIDLIRKCMPLVWILILIFAYALMTPHMDDARYMYPLLPIAFMMAGHGVLETWPLLQRASGAGRITARGLIFTVAGLALTVCYVIVFPEYIYLFAAMPQWSRAFPVLGALIFLVFGLTPLAAAIASREAISKTRSLALWAARILIPIGLATIFLSARAKNGLWLEGLGLAVAGASLSYWTAASLLRQPSPRQYRNLLAGVVALVFISNFPVLVNFYQSVSPSGLEDQFSFGYKQAAMEIKRDGLTAPGKIFCDRKPFLAYYLGGKMYIDRRTGETFPSNYRSLGELINSGKVDYIVADSYTLQRLGPQLFELSLGLWPPPGTEIIFSKCEKQSGRIISVYRVVKKQTILPGPINREERIRLSRQYLRAGQLALAWLELKDLGRDQEALAVKKQIGNEILAAYRDCLKVGSDSLPFLAPRLPNELSPQD